MTNPTPVSVRLADAAVVLAAAILIMIAVAAAGSGGSAAGDGKWPWADHVDGELAAIRLRLDKCEQRLDVIQGVGQVELQKEPQHD